MSEAYCADTDPGLTVLEAINFITGNKQRPNLARIFSHLHKTCSFSLSKCENILDSLLRDGRVVRINHLGNVIYMSPYTFKKNRNKVIDHEAQDRIQESVLSIAIASLVLKNPSYLDVGVPQRVVEDFILAIESGICQDAYDVNLLIERELDNSIVRLENGNFLYKVKPPRAGSEKDSVSVQGGSDFSDAYVSQRELNFDNKVKEMLISEQRSSVHNKAPDTELNKTIDKKSSKQKPNKNAAKQQLSTKKKSQTRLKEITTANKKQKLESKKSTEKLPEAIGRIKSCEPVYQCFLCKIYGCTTPSEPMVTCNNCNMRGHPICIVKEQRLVLNIPFDLNVWQCSKCRKDKTPKPKTDDDGPSCALSVTPSYKNIKQQHKKPNSAKGRGCLFKPLKCSICKTKGGIMVACNTCPKQGHPFCIKKQMELGAVKLCAVNDWQCQDCKTINPGKKIPRCVLCNSKRNLIKKLIKCSNCSDYYHKKCHKPHINDLNTARWKCMNCIRKDCDNALTRDNDEIKLTPDKVNENNNGSIVKFNSMMDIAKAKHKNKNTAKRLKVSSPVVERSRNAEKIEDENSNIVDTDLMVCDRRKLFENSSKEEDQLGDNSFVDWEIKTLNFLNMNISEEFKGAFNYFGKGLSSKKHEDKNTNIVDDNFNVDIDKDKATSKYQRELNLPNKIQTTNLHKTKETDELVITGEYCQRKTDVPTVITGNWYLLMQNPTSETVLPSGELKGEIEKRPFPDPEVPDPTYWSIQDVYRHFLKYFDREVAKTFEKLEIDGSELKLMKKSDIIKKMGFKLGIGLQVLLHVKRLQIRTNDRRIIWNNID